MADDKGRYNEICLLVSSEGEHAATWAFSGCRCGWQPDASLRRMPQYVAHVCAVLTAPDPVPAPVPSRREVEGGAL